MDLELMDLKLMDLKLIDNGLKTALTHLLAL